MRRKIGLLVDNPHLGRPLLGPLTGYRSLAVAAWRAICHVEERRLVVDIVQIALRRDVYG
ncbi:MAG: type II toxin-antitoxin system RelE/ParE family toxin [Planctomycetes bacterium]|nr:type II toxin-antitoxin system RelE/ParE family toxin [Planctomycetota bacterium]